jgi:hypothetical protein
MYFSWAEYRIRVYFNFGKALTCGACLSAAKPPCAVCRLAAWGGAVRHTPGHNRPTSTAPVRVAILSERARWPLTASRAPSHAELCCSVAPALFTARTTCCVSRHHAQPKLAAIRVRHRSSMCTSPQAHRRSSYNSRVASPRCRFPSKGPPPPIERVVGSHAAV